MTGSTTNGLIVNARAGAFAVYMYGATVICGVAAVTDTGSGHGSLMSKIALSA